MILVIGGKGSGRHTYVRETLNYQSEDIHTINEEDIALFEKDSNYLYALFTFSAVIASEEGCGIVPLQKKDREYREANGRLNCALASLAQKVILMTCSIPQVIKDMGDKKSKLFIVMRHGATDANAAHLFAGRFTDLPLNDAGIKQVNKSSVYLKDFASHCSQKVRKNLEEPSAVYASPLKRAVQTAMMMFPSSHIYTRDDLSEIDFGLFEGKSHKQLINDKKLSSVYQHWIDNYETEKTPSSKVSPGESCCQYRERTLNAFRNILEKNVIVGDIAVLVAHGGTQNVLKDSKITQSGQTDTGGFLFGVYIF